MAICEVPALSGMLESRYYPSIQRMNTDSQHHLTWERRQAELWDRIFQVTQDVVTLAESLDASVGGTVIKQEMVRAAMQVGKNVVRATASDTKEEFQRYLEEGRLQAVETDYWLRLAYIVQQREDVQRDLSSIISQYAAIVDLLHSMQRHIRDERAAVAKHTRGPRVS